MATYEAHTCPEEDDTVYIPQHAKDIPQVFTTEDGFCKHREDNLHCFCWWKEESCCSCGHISQHEEVTS